MKKYSNKIIGACLALFLCLSLGSLNSNFLNYAHSNINLTYISYLYNGSLFNSLFTTKVAAKNYISVKDFYITNKVIEIEALNRSVLCPLNGCIVKKGKNEEGKYVVIETKNNTYTICGISDFAVALYQFVYVGDTLGSSSNNKYNITTNDSLEDVCQIMIDYEEA